MGVSVVMQGGEIWCEFGGQQKGAHEKSGLIPLNQVFC